jgi:hypothetical protein
VLTTSRQFIVTRACLRKSNQYIRLWRNVGAITSCIVTSSYDRRTINCVNRVCGKKNMKNLAELCGRAFDMQSMTTVIDQDQGAINKVEVKVMVYQALLTAYTISKAPLRTAGNQRVVVCAIRRHIPHAGHRTAARFTFAMFNTLCILITTKLSTRED